MVIWDKIANLKSLPIFNFHVASWLFVTINSFMCTRTLAKTVSLQILLSLIVCVLYGDNHSYHYAGVFLSQKSQI